MVLQGTPRNINQPLGMQRNAKERKVTKSNAKERKGTQRNSKERKGIQMNAKEGKDKPINHTELKGATRNNLKFQIHHISTKLTSRDTPGYDRYLKILPTYNWNFQNLLLK